jgi:hypothetical protein
MHLLKMWGRKPPRKESNNPKFCFNELVTLTVRAVYDKKNLLINNFLTDFLGLNVTATVTRAKHRC